MTKKKTIRPKTLKSIKPNMALEKDYTKRLLKLTTDINKSFAYWSLATANKNLNKNISKQLQINFNKLMKQWEPKVNEIAKSEAERLSKQSAKYVNINLVKQNQAFALKRTPKDVSQALNAIYERNYNLIKTIPQDIKERFQSVFLNNVNTFDREAIEKQIKVISGISDRRAKVIARDQTQKAVTQYHAAREQNLGFEYYVWETSADEKVSTGKGGHRQLQGRIYRYDEDTAIVDSYGNVGHPSQRTNCRCRRRAVILQPDQTVKKVKDSRSGNYYVIVDKK